MVYAPEPFPCSELPGEAPNRAPCARIVRSTVHGPTVHGRPVCHALVTVSDCPSHASLTHARRAHTPWAHAHTHARKRTQTHARTHAYERSHARTQTHTSARKRTHARTHATLHAGAEKCAGNNPSLFACFANCTHAITTVRHMAPTQAGSAAPGPQRNRSRRATPPRHGSHSPE